MGDVLQSCDGTTVAVPIHDAGIKGHVAITIRVTRAADTVVFQIGLRNTSPGLDRIEGVSTSG